MKTKFIIPLILLAAGTAQAAENSANALNAPLPDYLSVKPVELNDKEKAALDLAEEWAKASSMPSRDSQGRLIYVHGASVPTIIGVPFQICDIELQPGEVLREIIIGDSARWLVDTAASGSPLGDITHVMLKPIDAGLETSAAITTDRRVYHIRLISQRQGHTPYIGFAYQEAFTQRYAAQTAKEQRAEAWQSSELNRDLSQLDFGYWLDGDDASWEPNQIYNDGRQTFIRLPASTPETPVLLVRQNQEDVLVNYRLKDNTIVVDGVFEHMLLILGVGDDQERINIIKEEQ